MFLVEGKMNMEIGSGRQNKLILLEEELIKKKLLEEKLTKKRFQWRKN